MKRKSTQSTSARRSRERGEHLEAIRRKMAKRARELGIRTEADIQRIVDEVRKAHNEALRGR